MRCNIMKINFSIDKWYRFSVIVICVLSSARGCAAAFVEDQEYPYEGVESAEEVNDDEFYDGEYEPTDKFAKPMNDRDEEKVREYVSDREVPTEVPVKVQIVGDLATPAPDSSIKLDFVPKQTYYQVRRYDTEMHLPRSAAFAEAETAEELLNAPRLREVVSHKKTQEVYEEQGYEDAGYDHGGYKKAGEHREKSATLPREHKTDFTQITDLSTEQSITTVVNITTESSHEDTSTVPPPTSQEPPTTPKTRKPKIRGSWPSRHRTPAKDRRNTGKHFEDKESRPWSPHNRKRRVKNNTTKSELAAALGGKVSGEGSEMHTTRKLPTSAAAPVTELKNELLKPTTYHPPVSPQILAMVQRDSGSKPAPTRSHSYAVPVIRVTETAGYKFENPFGGFKDFNEINASSSFPSFEYKSIPKVKYLFKPALLNEASPFKTEAGYKYYSPSYPGYRFFPKDTKYGESADINVKIPLLPTREPFLKPKPPPSPAVPPPRTVLKAFPHEIVNKKREELFFKPTHQSEKKYPKWSKVKDFPYEIVGANTEKRPLKLERFAPYKAPLQKLKQEKTKSIKYQTTKKEKPYFGVPDDSPWIPITPKEVYEIHGYDRKRPLIGKDIKVKVREDSIEAKTPIQQTPYAVSTSYNIKHVYPKFVDMKPPPYKKFLGYKTLYKFDLPKAVESVRHITYNTLYPTARTTQTTRRDDIQTLSSNRYAIFQKVNYTLPVAVAENATSAYDSKEEFNKSYLAETEKLLFRHPHLSRETSYLTEAMPLDEPQNVTAKRDIILTSIGATAPKNDTAKPKVIKRNDMKPIIVYPQDYTSTASFVEKLTLAHFADDNNATTHAESVLDSPLLPQNGTTRVKRGVPDRDNNEELVKIYLGGSTTQIAVDVSKYPFYKSTPHDSLSKYSVLRYVSNPNRIPRKKDNGRMSFYESTDHIECEEPTPLRNVVPNRENGKWAYDTKPQMPRIRNLGDKILCLKMKFFGSDPLDNPFFKEESIGFPLVYPLKETRHFDEVEGSTDNEYEIVPSWQILATPSSSRRTKKNADYRSLVRRWIDSLAEPNYQRSLSKRSAKIASGVDTADKKINHKVYLAGGFLNSKNSSQQGIPRRNEVIATNASPSSTIGGYGLKMEIPKLNATQLPSASNVLRSITKSRKNKDTVSVRDTTTDAAAQNVTSTPFKYKYKEPTWRLEKRRTPASSATYYSATPDHTSPLPEVDSISRPDVDSLLYVFHPKTGEGKWMKVLKVEDMANGTTADSLGSSNNDEPVLSLPSNASSERVKINRKLQKPCDEQDGAHASSPEYDVYHISGLMKQVAPLKATEVEINNLQSTEEHVDDGGKAVYDLDNDEDSKSTKKIPEPHERLYYYVLDDETVE